MKKTSSKVPWYKKVPWKAVSILVLAFGALLVGGVLIWISTFKIPDLASLRAQALSQSTKIYDRTGNTLLYDLNPDVKRSVVPFDQISQHMKDATVAIEDENFYNHGGISFISIARSMLDDVTHLSFDQGGSTITQQVIKNELLTSQKTISRKIKEWVLAIRLEQIADKDTILNLYLNSIPFGGNHYGIEEASEAFLGMHATDLDIAQSAYLAAMIQAPTHYSPYGTNLTDLENRKNLVLKKMLDNKFISQDEYTAALAEKVTWQPQQNQSIKAPHFVMYIKSYLEQKYGADKVDNGGLKVITTLDYTMQQAGEAIAKKYGVQNTTTYNASNDAFVALDPKTGQILTMIGSRDYFDKTIDGNYNVAISPTRQPGSTFKPIVYSQAFNMGYTPDTVLFDTKTQFSTACAPTDPSDTPPCYSPSNFDDTYRGPIDIRHALASSINIPAIKALYLVGINSALKLAQDMGITSLSNANQYGLTLVLGGGEVSPIEMADAYGVFADEGVRNPYTGILSVTDSNGNVLEQYQPNPTQVLPVQTAREITDILSDNEARSAEYGLDSPLYFANRDVAVKTGTTNNYVDAWIIGYTPNVVVATWAGNNDYTPMAKKISGFIVAPMWRAFMDAILPNLPDEAFTAPDPVPQDIKPVLRGVWQPGLADPSVQQVHDMLFWVDKSDPLGPRPVDPTQDSQYAAWEYGVQQWFATHGMPAITTSSSTPITSGPSVTIVTPEANQTFTKSGSVLVTIQTNSSYPTTHVEYSLNGTYIGTSTTAPFTYQFDLSKYAPLPATDTLKVTAFDSLNQTGSASIDFTVTQ